MGNYYEWSYDYGGEVAITSPLKKEEAVRRVLGITRKVTGCLALALSTSRTDGAELVGEVSGDKVTLARARPVAPSAGKPVFVGSFIESEAAGVMLQGRFTVNCLQKLLFWSGAVTLALFEAGILAAVLQPENAPLFSWNNIGMVFAIPVVGIIGFALTYHLETSMLRSDREWIEQELRRALAHPL